jgi:apolipoprotein N-acyltransferase
LYGVLFCLGVVYWVYFAVAAYFSFPPPIALLLTLLSYSVFIGVYTGVAALVTVLLMRCQIDWLRWCGIPAVWVCSEFARSMFFSGFSWELLGYTQYRNLALIQIADLTGVYGVSFLLAFSSYVTAELLWALSSRAPTSSSSCLASRFSPTVSRVPWRGVVSLLASVSLALLYGMFRLAEPEAPPSAAPVNIIAVHKDGGDTQRWQRVHYANSLLQYVQATEASVVDIQPDSPDLPDLVVWPEFAIGFYPERELALQRHLHLLTQKIGAPLLFGAPRVAVAEDGEHYYNSAYFLPVGGTFSHFYDKIRLLPFAEYRPWTWPTLLPHSPTTPSEFTAGNQSTVFTIPKSSFGVIICYEATYPHLSRRLVENGAQFLVNISNDTWLAGEAASAQHFSMAVFRAIENRRGLVRVATAGLSGFVDPFGRQSRLFDQREVHQQGSILPRQDFTVYTRYGDWFVSLCLGCVLLALFVARTSVAESSASLENQLVLEPASVHSPLPFKHGAQG